MRTIYQYLLYLSTISLLSGCLFSSSEQQRWIIDAQGTTSLALSRDGRFALAYSTTKQLSLWDLEHATLLSSLGSQDAIKSLVTHSRFADNGRFAVTASQTNFAVWDLAWGSALGLWSISDGIIRDIDIASNGQQVLLGLSNGKAIYVNLVTGRRLEFLAHHEKVNSVALSANGRFALSGGNDRKAYLWDTNSGQIIHHFSLPQRVNRVALQRDGQLAFIADGGNDAYIYDLTTGNQQAALHSFARQLIFSSARFSDDGQHLITGSPNGQVALWNSQNGKREHHVEVTKLKSSRPNRAVVYDATLDKQHRLITASSAGLVQAWTVDN